MHLNFNLKYFNVVKLLHSHISPVSTPYMFYVTFSWRVAFRMSAERNYVYRLLTRLVDL